ncbi:CHAD domain-containing protein [Pseudomonas sp. ABC1]|uniref:CHAD domain-containing protein n=1 Tax=Pseudomonas sp. ABC1 TaxID=2748080 RepID=UPI0015C3CE9E|nr:CHAD domain-containing protein [Pseudomonas sp. ABC1]QLF92775.1 CHAD domain-containing protein [Pseudomonas sp. ABC1]
MAYQLRPRSSVSAQVRKAACDRLEAAIDALAVPPMDMGEGIHQARKRIKELRALLRLVRTPLGATFELENQRLRDIARDLSESRDATAMLESWDLLARHVGQPFDSEAMGQVRRRLQARADTGEASSAGLGVVISGVQARLLEALHAVQGWSLNGKGFDLLADGLYRAYKAGGRELAKLTETPDDEGFHEWRKRVKDHWYQCRLLSPIWPGLMELRCESLKQLAEALGDEHDLYMMQLALAREPALFGDEANRAILAPLIEQRRQALRDSAMALGQPLYAEPPKALVERFRNYWKDARKHRPL